MIRDFVVIDRAAKIVVSEKQDISKVHNSLPMKKS